MQLESLLLQVKNNYNHYSIYIMIQRIQSIWLLLAAIMNAGVLYFDVYKMQMTDGTNKVMRIADHYPSLLIAIVMILVPLITIFMFTNRKRQLTMTIVSLLGCISFITMQLGRVNSLSKPDSGVISGSYGVSAILPAVTIIFLVMALLGIRKDEKLVKSMDRLR